MRVLHVASGRLFGGIEQMLVTIARHQAITPDVTATFAVAAPGRLARALSASGVQAHDLGDVRLSRPASVVRARRRFRALLQSTGAQAAICHAPWSYAIFAPVARRAGVPAVWWQHDRADGSPLVERWAARTPAALVIANSSWTSRSAGALQPDAPVTVIHPPVAVECSSDELREEQRRSLGAGRDELVVFCASRLEPWKGHRHLLRALANLRTSRSWRAWIAGGAQRPHEQNYAAELRREVAALGLESRVEFLGERRDVPSLMRAADIFCQPNERPEPFGVVFAEALLSGLPVVTTDMGGAPEIVSNQCGRLVPPEDTAALAGVLAELIDNEELRARLAAAGHGHATARCAPSVVLPQLARAVERVRVKREPPVASRQGEI